MVRAVTVIAGAYVLCPATILVARENLLCGAGMVFGIACLAAGQVQAARRREGLHWQRLTHGLCTNCGYDLRATPRRCPECGQCR